MTVAVTLDGGRIRIGSLLVYLERVLRPSARLPPDVVPRAHGVAPAALSADGEVVAAVTEGEAIWLGFQPTDRPQPAVVRVRVENEQALDAITGEPWDPDLAEAPRNYLVVPPDSRLVGVPHEDGVELFSAPTRLSILVVDPPDTGGVHLVASIRLVEPAVFERLTGHPPAPLDRGSAYTGWRAP